MTYRNPDLLALARLSPVCWGCGKHNDGDVVAAHRNEGKSMGLKNPDFMWAALCTLKCHYELDQGNRMDRDEKRAFWMKAYWRTQMWLWTSGLLTIAVTVAAALPPPRPKPAKKIRSGRQFPQGRKLESRNDWPEGRKLQSRPFNSNKPARAAREQ